MHRNLQNHALKLGVLGAIMIVASYSFFILLSCFDFAKGSAWLDDVYVYSNFSGISLVLFSLGLQSDSETYKKLLFYPSAILYLIVVISYAVNDMLDLMVQTKIIILPSILLTWICFSLFYKRTRH
jgi:uncharacterized membrane protein YbaN (DUF454 family)